MDFEGASQGFDRPVKDPLSCGNLRSVTRGSFRASLSDAFRITTSGKGERMGLVVLGTGSGFLPLQLGRHDVGRLVESDVGKDGAMCFCQRLIFSVEDFYRIPLRFFLHSGLRKACGL